MVKKNYIRGILGTILLFILTTGLTNHSSGLHLQLPEKTIDINKNDVEDAQSFQVDRDHFGVMLRLSAKAGQKLTTVTEGLVGQQVLWIWDGKVVYVQKLIAPLTTDVNVLNLTAAEAEEIGKLKPIYN